MLERRWALKMDFLMVIIMDRLMDYPVTACAGYHAIGAHVICGAAVTDVTAASQSGLIWTVSLEVFMGWMFGGVGFHAKVKMFI